MNSCVIDILTISVKDIIIVGVVLLHFVASISPWQVLLHNKEHSSTLLSACLAMVTLVVVNSSIITVKS